MQEILDVDLIGFERGGEAQRRAIVDGVSRSLTTGFVYLAHDLSEEEIDACYAQLTAVSVATPACSSRPPPAEVLRTGRRC